MGACVFSNLIVIKGNARDAYRQACEYANDYNGHQEGYSGDIQTTHGFITPKGKVPRYGTQAFQKWEDKIIDSDILDKRGNCMCVEITGAVAKRIKERYGYKGRKGIGVFYFFGWGAE